MIIKMIEAKLATRTLMCGGRSSRIFSDRPGYSSPPVVSVAADWNTVTLGQDATDTDRRRHLLLRRADALAYRILRRADGVDLDA